MQIIDRADFIHWTEGVMLDFCLGKGFAVPESSCIAAQDALDRGERVGLTVDGKIVSYLIPKEDGIYEQMG